MTVRLFTRCVIVTLIYLLLQPFRLIKLPCFDPEEYTVKQVTYNSKDGTEIPMFILHKKVRLSPLIAMLK